jgi:two-component system chemotaxis response regulator CheY
MTTFAPSLEPDVAPVVAKMLIVDDDPVLRQILHAYMVRAGYDVALAEHGQQALDVWKRDSIRMVITDWMMPVVDGPELIRRIRAESAPGYTYIIMLTAKESKGDVIYGLEAGADDYLTKPFNVGELRARVQIGERILNLENRLNVTVRQMEELATLDPLTGLLNRRALYHHAEAELARSRRDKLPVSLMMLDIDHFKQVNDKHGHLIGDKALKLVADTLKQNKRTYDWAGRWGGEEFLIVLPDTDEQQSAAIAERMRLQILETRLALPAGDFLSLQSSFGIASTASAVAGASVAELYTLDNLVARADEALLRAKNAGRNRVCLYTPPTALDDIPSL